MSLVEIETELARLSAAELRQLAMTSWTAFLEKEAADPNQNRCDEDDPMLLAALDEAVKRADGSAGMGVKGDSVRARIRAWTTR